MQTTVDTFMAAVDAAVSRRSFFKRAGAAGLGAAGVTLLGGSLLPAYGQATITDTDILNFALNLEYLEAEFYTVATTGKTLAQSGFATNGTGTPGATVGGGQVSFSDPAVAAVAAEIAKDEQAHVKLLRGALGANAVAEPSINLNALGFGFGSQTEFLALARAFEDTGVTAYAGAAPAISSASIAGTAARILAVEALHAGNIRLSVAQNNISTGKLDAVDILPPPSGNNYFSLDGNALCALRTTAMVLAIVYGGSGKKGGAFFPVGVNGTINMS